MEELRIKKMKEKVFLPMFGFVQSLNVAAEPPGAPRSLESSGGLWHAAPTTV